MTRDVILYEAADPQARVLTTRWRSRKPLFICLLAHTDTCLIPGISAAGATEELRPYTPAADAEVLIYGSARCLPTLPLNPLGPPGPAGITRAALRNTNLDPLFVSIGLRVQPDVPHVRRVEAAPGASLAAPGLNVPEAQSLFEQGANYARAIARGSSGPALSPREQQVLTAAPPAYVVLAESVPGGTTTALALLEALGIPSFGRISGSTAGNSQAAKEALVRAALQRANLTNAEGRADPLAAAAAIGDPMQPYAAGFLHGAAESGLGVLMGGGSQMIAVAALAHALSGDSVLDNLLIATTSWVTRDPWADVPALARAVHPNLPLVATNLDFRRSRHPALHRYEDGLVKEGVGAGGAIIAAHLQTGADLPTIQNWIDDAYDALLKPQSLESVAT